MLASIALLATALAGSAMCAATPAIEKRAPAPFSTFSYNSVFRPAQNAPLWRTAYSRAIQPADGSLLLTWEDYPFGESNTNLNTFKILRSTDGGATFSNLSEVRDTQNGWGMRFQPHMHVLKRAYGSYPAGTLLLAGVSTPVSLVGGVYIDLYTSTNSGRTWTFASHIAYGLGPETVATGDAAIWEPFFLEHEGKMLCYISDQRDRDHSQKLIVQTSTDLKAWSNPIDVVAYADRNSRPGMAVVTLLPNGFFMLAYEYCNEPGREGCPAHIRFSRDPLAFQTAPDRLLQTTSGYNPAASPYSVYLPGQGALVVSTNSDTDVFISYDQGTTFIQRNINQWTGQSRHLLVFNSNGIQRLHTTTAGFYGCGGSCYNFVANGVTSLEAFKR